MAGFKKTGFSGTSYHVTQRGKRGGYIFSDEQDRATYLDWLEEHCQKWQVDILSYCLMENHLHLVLSATTIDSLHKAISPLQMRYEQHINRLRDWKGNIWQGKLITSALDDAFTWSAIRYVERNPFRAGLVKRAEDYQWSSAAAHCGLVFSPLLSPLPIDSSGIVAGNWADWLALP